MYKKANNHAFIDSQNLNLSIRQLGWFLDYKKVRTYLKEKYGVTKAFMFIGYVEGNSALYTNLEQAGFICVFKSTLGYKDGVTKGNCDAELVLQAMIEFNNYEEAVIVTGDGDFYCLVKYLLEQNKLSNLMIPNEKKYSALFKVRTIRPNLRFMNNLQAKLKYIKKRPHEDDTS